MGHSLTVGNLQEACKCCLLDRELPNPVGIWDIPKSHPPTDMNKVAAAEPVVSAVTGTAGGNRMTGGGENTVVVAQITRRFSEYSQCRR